MASLVPYQDDGDVDESDGEPPRPRDLNSEETRDLNSETASEVGTPEQVVHPNIANLLSGSAMVMAPRKEAAGGDLSRESEAQLPPAAASQETDYGDAFSPLNISVAVDTDALHVELAAAQQKNDKLQAELRQAHATIAELKVRLEAGNEKRSVISKECSELRTRLQPQQLEMAKSAARSNAMVRAVKIITAHDTAIEAQAEHLVRMHADLVRMRKNCAEFLQYQKQLLSGASEAKSSK